MKSTLKFESLTKGTTIDQIIYPKASWEIIVDSGSTHQMTRTINWERYPVSIERVLLVQRLLLQWWGPTILDSTSTTLLSDHAFRKADILLRLMALFELRHKQRALCELEQEDWVELLIDMLFHAWKGTRNKVLSSGYFVLERLEKPLSKQHMERILSVSKEFYKSYHLGLISDGPEFELTTILIKKPLQALLKEDFSLWEKGGSYGSVPFVVAHLLLADALEILNSHRTQELLVYFETVQEIRKPEIIKQFWSCSGLVKNYRTTGDSKNLISTTEAGNANSSLNTAKTLLGVRLHTNLLSIKSSKSSVFKFPWNSHNDLLRDYNELQTAIYIIFLSVMGKRGPSEVRTLRAIDITPSDTANNKDAVMRSSIEKTHLGFRQEQGVTNFIDDSFRVLLKLGYVDKTNSKLNLFTTLTNLSNTNRKPKIISVQNSNDKLKSYYDRFCTRVEKKVTFEIKLLHSNLTTHQFRHSFAEFALRKFDGNVEELIRQHFCHSYNHWWIKRYTEDKLDSDAEVRINREYIRELVPRVLQDNDVDPNFVGAMALFIKKELEKTINVMSPDEAEAHIHQFCKGFVQVTAHEYGWCLLYKDFFGVAKCKDKSGKPSPASTSSEKCNSCANFLAGRRSHLDVQQKIAISHCDFLEQGVWSMPRLKKASAEAVHIAKNLFPEISALVDE